MENLFRDNFFRGDHLSPEVKDLIGSEKNPTISISYISVSHVGKSAKKGVERIRQVIRVNKSGKEYFSEIHNIGKYSMKYSCLVDGKGRKSYHTSRKNVDAEEIDEFEDTFQEKAGILPSDDFVMEIVNDKKFKPHLSDKRQPEDSSESSEERSDDRNKSKNKDKNRNKDENKGSSNEKNRENNKNKSKDRSKENNKQSDTAKNIPKPKMRAKSPAPSEIRSTIKSPSKSNKLEPSPSAAVYKNVGSKSINTIKKTKEELQSNDPNMIICSHEEEIDCLNQVNEYRAKTGLKPLVYNQHLRDVSLTHTINMFKKIVNVDHTNFKQRTEMLPECRNVGENVGFSSGNTNMIKRLMVGWIRSLHHRENIIGNFNSFGVSFAHGKNGDWYGTQLFAVILTKKMCDAVEIDSKNKKRILVLMNEEREKNQLEPLKAARNTEKVLIKHARRIACGKIEFGSGTINDRTSLIFGDEPHSYAEFSGSMLIAEKDLAAFLVNKWKQSMSDYILGDYQSVGISIAKDSYNYYTYFVGFSTP